MIIKLLITEKIMGVICMHTKSSFKLHDNICVVCPTLSL